MVAFRTSPPSRSGNGGTSVPPPAKLMRRGARERMFIGRLQRSLSVDFRAVSQNVSPDRDGEVRISEYAGRVVRNWYVVLITVVAAVLLVVLHTVGTGKQAQGQATVFLGTPLTPTGGSAQLNTVVANPTSATAYLHTSSVLDAAAAKAGIKSGAALRNHLSVVALQSSTTKTTERHAQHADHRARPLRQGLAVTAVQSLGDSLIGWANHYQAAKAELLDSQIATDKATIATLQRALKTAQIQRRSMRSLTVACRAPTGPPSRPPCCRPSPTPASRIDEISSS